MTITYRADAQAFLNDTGQPLIADAGLKLNLAHLTAAPPIPGTLFDTRKMVTKSLTEIAQANLVVATTGKHVTETSHHNGTAIVLGLQNFTITDSDPKRAMNSLFNDGIRVFQLCYQDANRFGGGFACPTVGITDECKNILENMSELGAILDLSHAGITSARQVLAHVKQRGLPLKVMVSHTGCYNLFPHMRNLPDDILREVVGLGGVVGIYTLTFGLDAKDNTTDSFTKHLSHAIKVCGAENIVVGSDGEYREAPSIEDMQCQFEKMKGMVDRDGYFNARCPAQPIKTFSADKMGVLAHEMWAALPTSLEGSIPGIAGLNLKRFFETALPN